MKDGSSSSSFDLEKKEEPGDKGIRENDIEKGMPESQHPAKDPNLIEFDGPDDPDNPQNFKFWKKWVYTISKLLYLARNLYELTKLLVYGLTTFAITYASSTFSSANKETAKQFNVSQEVMVLGTSLFVLVCDVLLHFTMLFIIGLLPVFSGFCLWPTCLGPSLGVIRSKTAAICVVLHFCSVRLSVQIFSERAS